MYSAGDITFTANGKILEMAKEGIFYGDVKKPPVLVVSNNEYKLKSTYAHEQLTSLAKEFAEITFIFFMFEIFGNEIEVETYSKLYKNLSDKKITPPEIIVSRVPIGGSYAGYSNSKKKIIVYEKAIDDAIKDNDKRAELMAMLVEEYGHHIDNLLRTELTTQGKEDKDIIDEGAKFAYKLFKFD